METKWIVRYTGPHITTLAHVVVDNASSTLCKLHVGVRYPPGEEALHCSTCLELEKRLKTQEGQLVYAALGELDVPPEVWALAAHVVRQNSKLATEIRSVRQRVEALGTFYEPG